MVLGSKGACLFGTERSEVRNPLAPTSQVNNLRLPVVVAVFRVWPICGHFVQVLPVSATERPGHTALWSSNPYGPISIIIVSASYRASAKRLLVHLFRVFGWVFHLQ